MRISMFTTAIATTAIGFNAMSAPAALVAEYTFNQTGTTATDVSGVGTAANGTLVGGATLDGSGYVTLDGTSGYVNFGHPSKLTNIPNGFTIEAFIKNPGTTGGAEPLIFGQDTSTLGVTLYRGTLYGYAGGGANNTGANYFGDGTSDFLVTVTYDQSSGLLSLYRNGVFSNSKTVSLASFNASTTLDFLSGTDVSKTQFLSGQIDQISYYDNALSSSQVSSDFAAGPDTTPVPTPEPAALAILGVGATALMRRRHR